MQSPDVNVLVNAFRADAAHHALFRAWLDGALAGSSRVGFSELVLSGTLRILTHPKIFRPVTPPHTALAFVDALLAQPASVSLRPGLGHWHIFREIVATLDVTGNRIPDAYHAALAMEHDCEWVTLDRGFSVYPDLEFVNLLDTG